MTFLLVSIYCIVRSDYELQKSCEYVRIYFEFVYKFNDDAYNYHGNKRNIFFSLKLITENIVTLQNEKFMHIHTHTRMQAFAVDY